MFPERIETERLTLTPCRPEGVDLAECYRICSSDPGIEEVTRYVRWSPHETMMETREFLAAARDRREAGEAAEYVLRPREGEPDAGEFAGLCGLECDWDRRTAEIGTWLRKRFWGRGYSAERAAALVAVAFADLDLDLVVIETHADNGASRRVVERYVDRFGGRREGRLRNHLRFFDGSVHDAVRYTISHEEWEESVDGDVDDVSFDDMR